MLAKVLILVASSIGIPAGISSFRYLKNKNLKYHIINQSPIVASFGSNRKLIQPYH